MRGGIENASGRSSDNLTNGLLTRNLPINIFIYSEFSPYPYAPIGIFRKGVNIRTFRTHLDMREATILFVKTIYALIVETYPYMPPMIYHHTTRGMECPACFILVTPPPRYLTILPLCKFCFAGNQETMSCIFYNRINRVVIILWIFIVQQVEV